MNSFCLGFAGLSAALFASAAHADTLIVGNKREHTVSFIDLDTGKEVARRETGKSPHEIAVSPDGQTAVLVSYREQFYTGNTLHAFDVATATKAGVISLGKHKAPHGLKWIPGTSRVIATTEASRDIVIVDVDAGEVVGSVKTGQRGSHMLALAPDLTRAFVTNLGAGSFTAINLETMTKIADVDAGAGAEAIAVTADGAEIWVGANNVKKVSIFDLATLDKETEFSTDGVPIRVELSPAGDVAAVSEFDLNRVAIYDVSSHERIASISLDPIEARAPVTLLFSPDGDRLWVAATHTAQVVEINTGDWSIARVFDAGEGSDGLAYSPIEMAAQK